MIELSYAGRVVRRFFSGRHLNAPGRLTLRQGIRVIEETGT